MEKTGCKIICGAPTTLAVKGLMMIMMMMNKLTFLFALFNKTKTKEGDIITRTLMMHGDDDDDFADNEDEYEEDSKGHHDTPFLRRRTFPASTSSRHHHRSCSDPADR